ncbi:uncharacterized protein LOC125837979 [Solanum verrucosum]|uniref:uncharacterized protein LOC125837979 n=1 Tax=Solanum verrucosum TaxID=315347 RepID=UPI0020D02B7C|nr:uncharacterized protein LOC125837979 [Solanum verrucosum]
MGKLFRKIGEENKPINSLELVASLSVEGVNLDTKVLCVSRVSKGIEVRASMPKLYVSKGFSLTQQDQNCLAKLKGPIFVKPVQQLPVTDSKAVPWNYNKIAVVYRGKEIFEEVDEAGGLTRSGRCYSPEEIRKGKMTQNIQVPLKKTVTEEEAEEFLNKIKVPDYSVMELLKKTPTQISLLSLLLHSEEHRRVLNKILNEAHVSKETMVNQLEKMAKRIFESNTITFTDYELPTEGAGHNRALFLTIKCEGYYVKRVMIDGGSGVDICPLSTLQNLKISLDKIRPSNIFVRAYDGSRRDTIGEIKLNMTIGPVDFMIVFQEIIVHGEDDLPIYRDPFIPYIEAKEGCLGLCSQGIVDPITLLGNQGTSGLGYKQSKRNGDETKNHKRTDWALPQPIPHIYHSFIKPQVPEMEASFTHEDIEEFIQDLSQFSVNVGFDNMTCMRNSLPDLKELFILESPSREVEYDEEEAFREINRDLEQFEQKPKPNLSETEAINLGCNEEVKEIKISLHVKKETRDAIIQLLFEYKDVFAWSYDDMPRLSVDLVVHKLPTHPDFPPVQQKRKKFNPDVSEKIKEEIIKQINANVIQTIRYTTWLANVVPMLKKDGKTRVCVDYRDLNKASPKDIFPLTNIHILVDNCARHEIQSFVDCCAGYHQILMDEKDAEKTAFTTPWGTYCYRVMPFGLKNVGETYMRAMTTMFHDMMHKEIEVYVDDVIIKSKTQDDHVQDLRKFFERVRRYDLKLNPAKCAFGVPFGKLLGFIVSRRGI